jgi:hypothetical protein
MSVASAQPHSLLSFPPLTDDNESSKQARLEVTLYTCSRESLGSYFAGTLSIFTEVSWLSLVPPEEYKNITSNRPRPIPSKVISN